MRTMISTALLALVAAGNLSAQTVNLKVLEDTWYYPFNATRGNRTNIPVFAAPYVGGPRSFNFHDAEMIVRFGPDPSTPEYSIGLPPANYQFTGVKVTLQHSASTVITEGFYNWQLGVTVGAQDVATSQPMYLNIHGVGSDTVNLATFAENSSYTGLAGAPTGTVRQPYPLNIDPLAATQNVTDLSGPTSWGTVTVSPSYTPGVANAQPFPVEFTLNVANTRVREYIQQGLSSGRLFFAIISNAPAAQGGATNIYPRFEANNIAGRPGGTDPLQANPNAATITFEGFSTGAANVDTWEMYQ
jgi:hypothetical protein